MIFLNNKKISYCTTCMNRLWQLKQTLPYNLNKLNNDEELCLVNYNSQDGLDDYIKDNFMDYINKAKLVYFYTKEPEYFHASKAKNLSHFIAKGEYVFNLDGDNFILDDTKNFLNTIKHKNFILQEYSGHDDGSFGRICLDRKKFMRIGGYDETLLPMGHQDGDLINRLKIIEKFKIYNPIKEKKYRLKKAIQNSKMEKIKNTGSTLDYKEQNMKNFVISDKNIKEGKIICNKNRNAIKGILNLIEEKKI